jgi:hypothetical protein
MKAFAVIILLALAACSTGEALPPIEGQWYRLSPDRWTPTPADQEAIRALPER